MRDMYNSQCHSDMNENLLSKADMVFKVTVRACGRVRWCSRIELVPNAACSTKLALCFSRNISIMLSNKHCVRINSCEQEYFLVVTDSAGT